VTGHEGEGKPVVGTGPHISPCQPGADLHLSGVEGEHVVSTSPGLSPRAAHLHVSFDISSEDNVGGEHPRGVDTISEQPTRQLSGICELDDQTNPSSDLHGITASSDKSYSTDDSSEEDGSSVDGSALSMDGSAVGMDRSAVGMDGSVVDSGGPSGTTQKSKRSGLRPVERDTKPRPSVIARERETYMNSIVQHLSDCHAVLAAVELHFQQLKKQWTEGLVQAKDVKMQVQDLLSEVEEQESEMDDIDVDLYQECKNEVKASKLDRCKQIRYLTTVLNEFLESLPEVRSFNRQLSMKSGDAVRSLSVMRKDITQLEMQTSTLKDFWSRGQLDPTEARTKIDAYMETIRNLETDGSIPDVSSLRSGRKQAQSLRWDVRPRLSRVATTLEELSMRIPKKDG